MADEIRPAGRCRFSAWVLLALSAVLFVALCSSAGAAGGKAAGPGPGDEQPLRVWAYFDGDTPVSGGQVHIYADGRELLGDGIGGSDVRTFSDGTALVLLHSLPSRLRVVITGGRAGGGPVRGSLKTSVDGSDVRDVIEVNPVTTVTEVLANKEGNQGGSDREIRDLAEQTLGIPQVLDDADLFATDRWFDGDRFRRWAAEQGSIEDGARVLAALAEQPGLDQHRFRPPGGDGPESRVAAKPIGAGANTVLDGIIEHIATAASGSGLHGIVFGLALKGIKSAIADGISGQEQSELSRVEAQLTEINARLAGLENQLKDAVFKLKIEATRPALTTIDTAERDLEWALTAKKPGWRAGNPDPPALGTKDRQEIFADAIDAFKNKAKLLDEQGNVASDLNSLLTKQLPNGEPPLITGVRGSVARNTRFFTSKSSDEIDRFFDYYKDYETRLAVLLSEYYSLNNKLPTAKNRVEQIRDVYLPDQRKLMPDADLDPSVFIDCGPKNCDQAASGALMYRTEPTYRSSKDVTGEGNYSKCTFYNGLDKPDCRLDAKRRFPGYADEWRPPLMSQAMQLFDGHAGDAVSWLNKAGVSFKPAARFPGYDPAALTYPAMLWTRDGWSFDIPGGRLYTGIHYTIIARPLALESRAGAPEQRHRGTVGHRLQMRPRRPQRGRAGGPLMQPVEHLVWRLHPLAAPEPDHRGGTREVLVEPSRTQKPSWRRALTLWLET